MSVPNWQRGVNLLAVETRAVELLSYSVRAVMQQNNFKLRFHYELGAPVVDLARSIFHNTVIANRTQPSTPEAVSRRRACFEEALRSSELLRAEINMNLWEFSVKPDCAKHWQSLIDAWREACFAWLRADRKKYGD